MHYANRDAWCLLSTEPIPGVSIPYDHEHIRAAIVRPGTTEPIEFALGEGDVKQVAGYLHYIRVPLSMLPTWGDYALRLEFLPDPQIPTDVAATLWLQLDVAEPQRAPSVTVDTCLLVGNVRTLTGTLPSWQSIEVVVHPKRMPTLQGSVAMTGEAVTTRTDADGHFEIPCVRGAIIVFEIPKCALRFQYQVPWDTDVIDMIDVFRSLSES